METHTKQEVVFDLESGTRLLVDVAPLKLLFEQGSQESIYDIVKELHKAKDVMIQSLSPGSVAAHLRELQDAHASISTLIKVLEQVSYRKINPSFEY